MLRKVLVPVMFLSVGVFSTTMFFAGCSSDSTTAGTGGKGGAGTGGVKGTGGAVGTGGTSVGTGGTAVTTGGAGGTATSTGGAAGGAVGTGGSAGAGGARTGGAGGAVGGTSGAAGGTSGAAGGASGAAGGMSGAAGGAGGAPIGGAGGATVWATTAGACMNPLTNVSVVDFCSYYMTKCADAYGTGVHQFANVADCTTKYTAYNATQKGCTAYHLCVAGTSAANATVHCPHPAGGTTNPCAIP